MAKVISRSVLQRGREEGRESKQKGGNFERAKINSKVHHHQRPWNWTLLQVTNSAAAAASDGNLHWVISKSAEKKTKKREQLSVGAMSAAIPSALLQSTVFVVSRMKKVSTE